MTTATQTQHRFDASIIGTEVRGARVMLKLDWKLPGSRYEFTLYVSPDEAESLNVGDRLHWSIVRGSLKDGKDGKYSTDYFWDWDKDGSAAPRSSPTVYEATADEDWEGMGDQRAGEPIQNQPDRSETPITYEDREEAKWDTVNAKKDAKIIRSVSFSAAIDKIDPSFFAPGVSGEEIFEEICRLRDLFVRVQESPTGYCFIHGIERTKSSKGSWFHRIDENFCMDDGIKNASGNPVEEE